MRFAICPLHLCKVLRLPRKIDARSYQVLHLSRKIISANLKIWYSKMQPLSGNERPDLRTSLMNMSFVLHLPCEMHLWRSSSNAPRLPSFLEMLQNPHVLLTFDKVHNPLRLPRKTTSEPPKVARTCIVFCTFSLRNVLRATTACTFSTSQLPKVVRHWGALYILTSKCNSRHNGVHFFDIATSKSGPKLRCFVHFGFEMCFAPQRRALFRHLNFQKCSETQVFCTFWLRNLLRATAACNFSFLISPDVSAPAALASLLSTLRSHKISKFHSVSRLSYLFAHLHLLSSDLFSSDFSPLWLCSRLALRTSAFWSVHIVGSSTSKLPSTIRVS